MVTKFHFRESLAETSLAELFYTIYRHRVPGLIELTKDGIHKRVFISSGNVIHATSTDKTDRLGVHLYRSGKLSRSVLEQTMAKRAQSGKRHGELLIEDRLLAPNELAEAIRGQMAAIVWSVFSWQQGEVTFRIGEFEDPLMIKIHLPMRQVILRGISRVPDPKALVGKLGSKGTVYKPNYGTEDLVEIALNRDEYQLLTLVNGRRRIYDICAEGPYSMSENARRLYAFGVLQLIRKVSGDTGTGQVMIRMADKKISSDSGP